MRFRFAVGGALVTFGFLALFRIAFFLIFHSAAPAAPAETWARAFSLGLRFDLRLGLILALPVLLLTGVPGLDPRRSRTARGVWLAYFLSAWTGITFLYFTDLGHYGYLHARLDASAIDLLQETGTALRMVWDSYPVLEAGIGLLAIVSVYAWVLRRVAFPLLESRRAAAPRGVRLATGGLALLLVLAGIYGKVSWYPLRWSDAFFSTNPLACALGLNPVLHLVDTWEGREQGYDREAVASHYPDVAAQLGVTDADAETLRFARIVPGASGRRPRNVVIVLLESFAAFKSGVFGNPMGATPRFDAIARESLLFRNFFAPCFPTARAVFGLVTGIPDVNAARSASRNPRLARQGSLVNAFEGFSKLYFLGGSASWGNIRGFLRNSIPDLRIYEEGDYDSPRVDGWGISDFDLFREAHAVLAREAGPFLAILQTSGNHRPYTIPEDSGGFVPAQVDEETLWANSFDDGVAEYNALRFLDHALGAFFDLARGEPYFADTVFFLLGDHGTVATRALPWEQIGLSSSHVPLAIHAPAFLPRAEEIDTVSTSLDVLPTAAALVGIPHTNATMGRDLLRIDPDEDRYVYVGNPRRIGVVGRDFYLTIPQGGTPRLHRHRSADPVADVRERYPEQALRMERLCHGFYETARYLLFHGHEGR